LIINGVNPLDIICGVTSIQRMEEGSLTRRAAEKIAWIKENSK
jgi:hypothetical protein